MLHVLYDSPKYMYSTAPSDVTLAQNLEAYMYMYRTQQLVMMTVIRKKTAHNDGEANSLGNDSAANTLCSLVSVTNSLNSTSGPVARPRTTS